MLYHDFLKEKLTEFLDSEKVTNKEKKIESSDLFSIEIPSNQNFGDISTNIAMVYCKDFKISPQDLAKKICKSLKRINDIEKLEIVAPGFINIFFKDIFWSNQLEILMKNFNNYKYSVKKKKICIEFVSANPTGLMHIGHARGAVLGDTIASILEEVGHEVAREYYINDAGEQIKKLMKTINFYKEKDAKSQNIIIEQELYPGDYLKLISKELSKEKLDSENNASVENQVLDLIMRDIKTDLQSMKVNHHSFISEKQISTEKNINNLMDELRNKNLSYYGYQDKPKSVSDKNWKREKQLLFKSKKLGDDMDRALLKPNGELTYFMSDIIYHQNKVDRNYDLLINIWGIDHSGYVTRLKNAINQLNKNKSFSLVVKLTSLVNLLEGRQAVKMSKRSGNYVTLRDVVEKVGVDVLRFMMISRNADKKIDFDFEIVKSKTKDNPVFYIQYAYARCMSLINIFNQTFNLNLSNLNIDNKKLSRLNLVEEKILIKKLCNFFNIIISAANNYEPHKLTNYLFDLAKDFHAYWGVGRLEPSKKIIIQNDLEISKERMILVFGISLIIKKGMSLLKISCPESM